MKKMVTLIIGLSLLLSMVSGAYASDDTYTVEQGDVLWKIALENNTTWENLAEINVLDNPNLIFPGQKLQVTKSSLTNSDKAVAVLESIETGDLSALAYVNPNQYIQHNLSAGDGLQGFGELLGALPEGSASVNVIRVIEDGDFVITHTEYNFFGPKIGFDIFRFEDGLIVEHWDNLAETSTTATPSGHTQIDGVTQLEDLSQTLENKKLVEGFVNEILMAGKFDLIGNYFDGDAYIQHNTQVADGVSGLGTAIAAMADNGIFMVYEKNHMILGEGNFVLSVSEGTFGGTPVAYYDLFRIENGYIAEHWDVIQDIPNEEQWQNENGKF